MSFLGSFWVVLGPFWVLFGVPRRLSGAPQAKTRIRLTRSEQACVGKLEALLKESSAEAHEDVPIASDAHDVHVDAPSGAKVPPPSQSTRRFVIKLRAGWLFL